MILTKEECERMRGCLGLDFPVEEIMKLFDTIAALRAENEELRRVVKHLLFSNHGYRPKGCSECTAAQKAAGDE